MPGQNPPRVIPRDLIERATGAQVSEQAAAIAEGIREAAERARGTRAPQPRRAGIILVDVEALRGLIGVREGETITAVEWSGTLAALKVTVESSWLRSTPSGAEPPLIEHLR